MEFFGLHITEEIPSQTLGRFPNAIAVATFEGNRGEIYKVVLEAIPRQIVKYTQEKVLGVFQLEQMPNEILKSFLNGTRTKQV